MVAEERQERGAFRRIEEGDGTKLFEHDGYDSARFGSRGKHGQVSKAGPATVSSERQTSGSNPRMDAYSSSSITRSGRHRRRRISTPIQVKKTRHPSAGHDTAR